MKPTITIEYCTQCNWMLRSAWYAQELLSTFAEDLAAVRLAPGRGGIFEITVDENRIWSRQDDGGFPPIKDLKQRVRDIIDPGRHLGHVDRSSSDS